jgi:hypothetical protein
LLLRLAVATTEEIPKLTGLLMQVGEHLSQVRRTGPYLSRKRHATRRGSLLQHLQKGRSLFRRQLAHRLSRRLSILIGRHGVGHFTIPLQNLLIGVALGRLSLFVSINKILIFFLLPTAE